DVQPHPRERDLRHSIAHARRQDVKRDECRACITKTGNQTYQRVESKTPAEHRYAKQIVHDPAEALNVLLYRQRMRVTCCQKNFPTFARAPKAFLSPPDFWGVCLAEMPRFAANSESGGAISSSPRFAVSQRVNVRPISRLCSTGASATSAMRRSSS